MPLTTFLAQRLPAFPAMHPGITVQVTVDDKLQDIVADGSTPGWALARMSKRT
ncbi:hypothetical protein [Salipiger bermudensis]|uniref:hypothetical protein n=1 Tax=Salipiger bermudensis TaxID=344736 RepID=UPI003008848E